MKKLIALLLAVIMLLSFGACAKSGSGAALNVMALKGPTGINTAKLASDNASGYNITFASAPEEITGKLITGECDIACVPTNLASVLYKKTNGGVKVAAVTTLGVLYIVDTSGKVNSLADLSGMTIGATGKGSNPEYILNKLLADNGLEGKVEVNYFAEHAELASHVVSGEIQTAMLPEPFVTQVMANCDKNVNTIDLQSEWEKTAGGVELAQGVIVVRSETIGKNKAAVDKFLEEFKQSSEYAADNIADAAQICEDLGIIASAKVAERAIPRCNIVYISGENMKNCVNGFLNTLFEANPASIGGEMPSDDFYYAG